MIVKSVQKNGKKNVFKFLIMGFSKELVITVGNKSVSINTYFRFEAS